MHEENAPEAGGAAQVLARLGLTQEQLRRGDVPESQRAGYSLAVGDAAKESAESPLDAPTGGTTQGLDNPEELARTIALRKLSAAPQSRAMLAEAMAAKDVPEEVAHRVLDRLTEVGLIDDAEYAAMLVRTRHTERHQARFAISQELRRRGIAPHHAERALEQIDERDEHAAALEFAAKKMRSMQGLEPEVRKRRLVAALSRRGFPAGMVYSVVTEVLDTGA